MPGSLNDSSGNFPINAYRVYTYPRYIGEAASTDLTGVMEAIVQAILPAKLTDQGWVEVHANDEVKLHTLVALVRVLLLGIV